MEQRRKVYGKILIAFLILGMMTGSFLEPFTSMANAAVGGKFIEKEDITEQQTTDSQQEERNQTDSRLSQNQKQTTDEQQEEKSQTGSRLSQNQQQTDSQQEDTYTLTGRIMAENQKGIANAEITIGDLESRSRADGTYFLESVPRSAEEIVVNRAGFEGTTKKLRAEGDTLAQDVVLSLKPAQISMEQTQFHVGERVKAEWRHALPEEVCVSWYSSDAEVAEIQEDTGEILGKKKGSAEICAVITSVYGAIPVQSCSVNVQESKTVLHALSAEQTDEKSMTITAEVKTEQGQSITEGMVRFELRQRKAGEGSGFEEPVFQTCQVEETGKAVWQFTRAFLDLCGEYQITAQYLGEQDKYLASGSAVLQETYPSKPLCFLEEIGGQEQTVTKEKPLLITYGEEKEIYVAANGNTVQNSIYPETFQSEYLSIKQEAFVNGKEEYTKLLLRAEQVTKEEPVKLILRQQEEGESIYPELYVKVLPREVCILPEETEMEVSKIYDREKRVFHAPDTEDVLTLTKAALASEEILPEDREKVSIDLEDVWRLQGELPEDFDGNVQKEEGIATEISFAQSGFQLCGEKAENYCLKPGNVKISARVNIKPRQVHIQVSDAERDFGSESSYVFAQDPWLEVEQGECNGISGILEENFSLPDAGEILIEEVPEGKFSAPGIYALSADPEAIKGIKKDNYIFLIKKGILTIHQEKILNPEAYLDFERDAVSMYVKPSQEGKEVWLKAEGGELKTGPAAGKPYDTVLLKQIQGQTLSHPISLTEEGYVFQRNDVLEEETVELTLQLSREGRIFSEEFSYSVYLDASAPNVSMSDIQGELTGFGSLLQKITFGRFGTMEYKVNVQAAEKNTSGLKNWRYMVLSLTEDKTKQELLEEMESLKQEGRYRWSEPYASEEVQEITISRKMGQEPLGAQNYVVLVKACDQVGNSKLYTSLGIILDHQEPHVELELAEGQEIREVYHEDIFLQAKITDALSPNQSVSGIQTVYTQTAVGKENLIYAEKHLLYEAEKGKTYTLQELHEQVLEKKIKVSKALNSNDIWVQVTAVDHSGNQYSVQKHFQIDITRPKIQVAYETKASEAYAPYYNKPRTATLTIQERNLDIYNQENLAFTLKTEQKEKATTYALSALGQVKGIKILSIQDSQAERKSSAYTDARRIEIKICFQADHHYTFGVSCKDQGNWASEARGEDFFVIDQTAPVLHVQYFTQEGKQEISENPEERFYTKQSITAQIQIQEHNFAQKGEKVSIDAQVERERGNKVQADYRNVQSVGIKLDNMKIKNIGENFDNGKNKQSIPSSYLNFQEMDGLEYQTWLQQNQEEVWQQNEECYTSSYTFSEEGNYTYSLVYTDLAGNQAIYEPRYFAIDQSKPKGSVSIQGFGFWDRLLEKITFGLFSPSAVEVEIQGMDEISPIFPIQYARFQKAQTREELEAFQGWTANRSLSRDDINSEEAEAFSEWLQEADERQGLVKLRINPEEQFVFYARITDYAGNEIFVSSDGMVLDGTEPGVQVNMTNLSQAEHGIFQEDVVLEIEAEDSVVNGTYSGLERVWYTISAENNVSISNTIEVFQSENRVQGNQHICRKITIPAELYNSNQVKVQAFAMDFAGNVGKSEMTELKIDVTPPVISVEWDSNQPVNGTFYPHTRTATISVEERNFDPSQVQFSITNTEGNEAEFGTWKMGTETGKKDENVNLCRVSFPFDGDYTFSVSCTDLAGNRTEFEKTEAFTIDKTLPIVNVSYNQNHARNGHYFQETREAVITIQEHNFDPEAVHTAISASLQGAELAKPVLSRFSSKGDVHTASIQYQAEGDYTFSIACTDLAGNQAAPYEEESFTIDLTPPEIEIMDILPKSANKDVAAPGIEITDVNYDHAGISVSLTGANHGELDPEKAVLPLEKGERIKYQDFARIEEMDDFYTLHVKAVDKAGNEAEDTIVFSVNRYGSVYVLERATKAWLLPASGEHIYIKKEQNIGIIEYNVDCIENSTLVLNRDGELLTLQEKRDYTVKRMGKEGEWKENHYNIHADNFAQEGNYQVILSTQDKAGNAGNNTSMRRSIPLQQTEQAFSRNIKPSSLRTGAEEQASKLVKQKQLPIQFTVDKTAPTIVVSGIEDHGQYPREQAVMTMDAKDNLALAEVTVHIAGNKKIYSAEELRESEGVLTIPIASAANWQEIQITAEDAAGNQLGQNKDKNNGEPIKLRILVTPNIMLQFYRNKPLFCGSLAGIAAAVIGIWIWKQRRYTSISRSN